MCSTVDHCYGLYQIEIQHKHFNSQFAEQISLLTLLSSFQLLSETKTHVRNGEINKEIDLHLVLLYTV